MHIVTAAAVPEFMDVRTRLPARALAECPNVSSIYHEQSFRFPALPAGTPRILILQRPPFGRPSAWKAMVGGPVRLGWVVVCEFDDHPELIAQIHGIAPEWDQLAGSHAVQTSTEPLASVFRPHNGEVALFPNAAFSLAAPCDRSTAPAKVFYGALNRGAFSVELARALAPSIAAHPETFFHVVRDRRFFDALPTARKSFEPKLGYDDYLAAIGAADIALLPLAGGEFEMFKSDLKYVEAGSRCVATIASPAVYGESIVHEGTGLIASRLADWAPALTRLLGDGELRTRLARNAWADVRSRRMFSGQIEARLDWYRKLWRERDRLQVELLARCPWLGGR
jgi:hypothetical protein